MARSSEQTPQSASEPAHEQSFGQKLQAWALRRKLVRAFLLFSGRNAGTLADAVTYRTLFAIFAALILAFSIVGLVFQGDPEMWHRLMTSIEDAIPGVGEAIALEDIKPPTGFSITTAIAVLGLIGAALGAVSAMGFALRELDGTIDRSRNPVWEIARKLAIALGVGVLFALSAAISYAGTEAIGWLSREVGFPNANAARGFLVEALSVVVVFLLNLALIALLFTLLSGLRAHRKQFWSGAIIGALGLLVLQQLSSIFVGGAVERWPVAGTAVSIIALLLWLNLSAQVILFASAYIITGVQDDEMTGPFPTTLAEFKVLQARRSADSADAQLAVAKTEAGAAAETPAADAPAALEIATSKRQAEKASHRSQHDRRP